MGVFDKFLDIMKLNDDDYDDDYNSITRTYCCAFVIDGQAYITLGQTSGSSLRNNYWIYDPDTDLWRSSDTEDDFDYMENEDVAFVVKNPHSEEDLLIELCGEFSVFFEKWHGEYPATEEGYAQMTQDVQAVLAGSAGALSLYTEDGWQGTALCTEKPGPDADAAGLLERCWSAEKPHKPLEKGSRVELVYWDPAQHRALPA